MEEKRKLFHTFLTLHAHKVGPTDEPVAHLHFCPEGTHLLPGPVDPLIALSQDDILDALDPESELVRWLLEQLRTYDCTRQRIVGLVFDRQTVLSEVLRCAA